MADKYLNYEGVQRLVEKLKTYISNAVKVTGVKGDAESTYRTGNVNLTAENVGAISKSAELLTTNPFNPPQLNGPYISKIDNSLYAADKRWTVTATNCTGSVSTLFDGNYESQLRIDANATSVITIDFSNTSTGYFPSYPYGYYLISFYYRNRPASVSARVYCNYEAHGIGWHDLAFDRIPSDSESQYVYRSKHQGLYNISIIEFTIVGDGTNATGYTSVTQIEMHSDRPDPKLNPFLSKYGAETLYYNLTAPNFIGNLNGTASNATKVNNHTVNSDVPANAVFTDTTYSAGDGLKLSGTTFKDHRGIEYIRGTWTEASGTWTGVSEDSELYDGKQILLYMPFAGSGNATLNLTLAGGGTTGAKNVYFENTSRFTTHKGQNSLLHLIYYSAQTLSNGTTYEGWWYVANRDTTNIQDLRTYYRSLKTKTELCRYQIVLTIDHENIVPVNAVNNNVGTTKTLTTESFDPLGAIYYYASSTRISSGSIVNTYLETQHSSGLVDLRYSFNTGQTLTAGEPLYIVCTPQGDGLVKLYSSPIAQALPSSEDGLLYIYIGNAYDTYRFALVQNKPVYWYKNGEIRLYTHKDVVYDPNYVHTDNNFTTAEKTKIASIPANAVYTDTVTTATTTGSGNAVTAITASNGALTVTKGATYVTSAEVQTMIAAAIDDIVDGNEVSY